VTSATLSTVQPAYLRRAEQTFPLVPQVMTVDDSHAAFVHSQTNLVVLSKIEQNDGKQWLQASQHNTTRLAGRIVTVHLTQVRSTRPSTHHYVLRPPGQRNVENEQTKRQTREFSPHFSFQYLLQAISLTRGPAVHAARILERPTKYFN
jgi:hypothetical protein